MNYLSLFSGIGAPESALKNIGIDYNLVGFSEIDKYAVKSYCEIHGVDESLNLGDITNIDLDKLPKNIDLLTGGFPCQDISVAGKQKGIIKGETRSGLMYEMMDIIKHVKPKVVLAENVKNILSEKHRPQLEEYLCFLSDLGYEVTMDVLNSKDFGIPQSRERIYIIGVLKYE